MEENYDTEDMFERFTDEFRGIKVMVYRRLRGSSDRFRLLDIVYIYLDTDGLRSPTSVLDLTAICCTRKTS